MKFSTSTTILESEMRQIPPVFFSYSCRRLKDMTLYAKRKKKESNLKRFSGVSKFPLLTRFMCVGSSACIFNSPPWVPLNFLSLFFRSVCNPVSRRRLCAFAQTFFLCCSSFLMMREEINNTHQTDRWSIMNEMNLDLNEKCVNFIEFHISLLAVQESASFAIAKLTIFLTNFFLHNLTLSHSHTARSLSLSLFTDSLSILSHEMEKKLVIRRHLAPATRGMISIENCSDNFTFGGHSTSLTDRSVHSGWIESTHSAS